MSVQPFGTPQGSRYCPWLITGLKVRILNIRLTHILHYFLHCEWVMIYNVVHDLKKMRLSMQPFGTPRGSRYYPWLITGLKVRIINRRLTHMLHYKTIIFCIVNWPKLKKWQVFWHASRLQILSLSHNRFEGKDNEYKINPKVT